MTVELLDWEAPNGIEVLLAWLAPLDGVCGPDRPTGDGWPYRQVTRVTGPDDKVTDFGLYSVHTFATGPDKEAAFTAAADAAQITHRRLLAMAPPLAPQRRIAISGGRIIKADSITATEGPRPEHYGAGELVARQVARYRVELRFAAVL